MRFKVIVAASAAGSLTLAGALFGGCSDDTTTGTGGGGGTGADLDGVIYQSAATDEALEALLAATPANEPEKAAVFDAPEGGDTLPATPIPTFRWHAGTQAITPVRSPVQWFMPPMRPNRTPSSRFADLLQRALSGVPSAYAHGDPVNGPAYFLVLSTASNAKLVRVFTLSDSYTPDAATWGTITDAGEPIFAAILSAEFESNRVIQGGGPWQSEPITFTVGE